MAEDKERRVSERSLENLKLGAQARYQGKVRHNFTILPETSDWLKQGGNASGRIDELVKAAKNGELKPNNTHNGKDSNLASEDTHKRIADLEAELTQLRSRLEDAEAVERELRYQEAEARRLAVEWQQKQKAIKALLEKVSAKQKGYLSNSFGQGLKDLKELI